MLKIRLQRVGKKHEPTYRVVVCDSKRGPKSGDNIEIIGSYDARDKNETKVDGERANYWISQGAQVSDTVHNLLINLGIIKGDKINVLPKKSPIVKEQTEEEKAATEKTEETAETKEDSSVTKPAEASEEKVESSDTNQDTSEDVEAPVEEKKEESKESLDDARDETEVSKKPAE